MLEPLSELQAKHDTTSAEAGKSETKKIALSPMQKAYWIGEKGVYPHSCIGFVRNAYRVTKLDIEALQSALTYICQHVSILKMQIDENGMQSFDGEANYRSLVHTGGSGNQHNLNKEINDIFEHDTSVSLVLQVEQLNNYDRLSVSMRLTCVDGRGYNKLIECLGHYYHIYQSSDQTEPLIQAHPAFKHHYGEYINYLDERRDTRLYRKSKRYWNNKVKSLPLAPRLPLLPADVKNQQDTKFNRLSLTLDTDHWERLKERCKRYNVTENAALLHLYAKTIAYWSENKDFSLNMLVSDHSIEPTSMLDLIGNCSTTLLVPYFSSKKVASLVEGISTLQKQLLASLEHRVIAGVDLIRMMENEGGDPSQRLMPYVFNSSLGADNLLTNDKEEEAEWQWLDTYIQTPQVYLDVQVYDQDSMLYVHWDYLADHFCEGVIEGMHQCFGRLLSHLSAEGSHWDAPLPAFTLPESQYRVRKAYNASQKTYDTDYYAQGLIHSGFLKQAACQPEAIALQSANTSITYGELYARASHLAAHIQQRRQHQEQGLTIAIYTLRGIEQVIGVLAISMSENIYLPVDSKLPEKRVSNILSHSQADLVICDNYCKARLEQDHHPLSIDIDPFVSGETRQPSALNKNTRKASDTAYVIYTSGSTGDPKGVVIAHGAAVNTLNDMIKRFGLGSRDCVLGLSSLNFDLSVYDIFATLAVGARLVITDEQPLPDPNHWLQLIEQYSPTVWNSVPALFELFLEHQDYQVDNFHSLRLVMLSGDWINPGMCKKVLTLLPSLNLVSLGGATEASIWSNYHRIHGVADDWPSIPYGTPLANQSLHVLDADLAAVPEWVVGDLYIGGVGVAEGYLRDETLTEKQFIQHDRLGRIYKTGDLAKFRQGLIEFIGRSDAQVKIRGYRIELEEIEAQAAKVADVDSAIAVVVGTDNANKSIALFYTLKDQQDFKQSNLSTHLSAELPSYMQPQQLLEISEFPLTPNGKVDRKTLIRQAQEKPQVNKEKQLAENTTQMALIDIWAELLDSKGIDIHDNFFAIGGSSILAIKMVTEIRKRFEVNFTPSHVLQFNSIYALSELLDNQVDISSDIFVKLSNGSVTTNNTSKNVNSSEEEIIVMIHPVGGSIESYKPLASLIESHKIYAIQSTRQHSEERLKQHSLEEVASYYAEQIQSRFANKKIILGGWSMGAVLALSVLQHLDAEQLSAKPMLLIDPWVSNGSGRQKFSVRNSIISFIRDLFLVDISLDENTNTNTENPAFWSALLSQLKAKEQLEENSALSSLSEMEIIELYHVYYFNSIKLRQHKIAATNKNSLLFQSSETDTFVKIGLLPIKTLCEDLLPNTQWCELSGDHWDLIKKENLQKIADNWKNAAI